MPSQVRQFVKDLTAQPLTPAATIPWRLTKRTTEGTPLQWRSTCSVEGMGFFVSGLSSGYLQSVLGTVLQISGLTSNAARNSPNANSATSVPQPPDGSQSSPFATLLDTLQQLYKSNPAKYSQVAEQIATNLGNAAETAQSSGRTTAANALNQLASDFSNAAQNNQPPSVQDMAKAVHLHGHHSHHLSASAFQADASQIDSLNPMSIISNTLSSAGIGASRG